MSSLTTAGCPLPTERSDSRFLVRRLGWHQNPHGDNYTRRLPLAVPVADFETFDEAEKERRRREQEARAGENPFRFGGATLFFQTSLDRPRLHDWLLDGGIDPPTDQFRHRDWREWWDFFAHTWTESQIEHAWQGLDKVRFFDVVEEESPDRFHVVTRLQYARALRASSGSDREGGTLWRVYRKEKTAVAACEQREPLRTMAYYEVVAIPGSVSVHAGAGYLLQRRAFDPTGQAGHDREGRDTGSRVPLRLFEDRARAIASRDELIAAAREVLNLFQVFTPPMAGRAERTFLEAIEGIAAPLPIPSTFRPELWREWWDLCQDDFTPDQRVAGWGIYADQPLFEVLRVEVNEG
jgi:hypothetical protein